MSMTLIEPLFDWDDTPVVEARPVWVAVPVTCSYCGAVSPNQVFHDANHTIIPASGMCVRRHFGLDDGGAE